MSGFELRDMIEADARAVLSIYQEGRDTGQATFQQTAPAWTDFDQGHLAAPRLVAVAADDGNVLGWAAGSPVSARPVYRGVVEESIYIGSAARGRGVGRTLLNAYVAATEAAGIWTLQAGIFPENPASLALHQGCGFEIIGTRQKIGKMGHGPWADGRAVAGCDLVGTQKPHSRRWIALNVRLRVAVVLVLRLLGQAKQNQLQCNRFKCALQLGCGRRREEQVR